MWHQALHSSQPEDSLCSIANNNSFIQSGEGLADSQPLTSACLAIVQITENSEPVLAEQAAPDGRNCGVGSVRNRPGRVLGERSSFSLGSFSSLLLSNFQLLCGAGFHLCALQRDRLCTESGILQLRSSSLHPQPPTPGNKPDVKSDFYCLLSLRWLTGILARQEVDGFKWTPKMPKSSFLYDPFQF